MAHQQPSNHNPKPDPPWINPPKQPKPDPNPSESIPKNTRGDNFIRTPNQGEGESPQHGRETAPPPQRPDSEPKEGGRQRMQPHWHWHDLHGGRAQKNQQGGAQESKGADQVTTPHGGMATQTMANPGPGPGSGRAGHGGPGIGGRKRSSPRPIRDIRPDCPRSHVE